MDIQNTKEKETDEVMDWNEIFSQDNIEDEEEIYCAKCLQIPKYTIVVTKNKIIQLTHKCKEKDEKINFHLRKSHILILLLNAIIAIILLLIFV